MALDRRPEDMVRITTPELAQAFIDEQIEVIREQVGDKKVLLALSGGVDSSVVAALLIKAIGKQLTCVHVNHGLLRKGEPEQVIEVFAEEARKLDGIEFLAQGTIWPDILESEEGIKAHHNAGGLPEDMNFELVEPVRILFKDEVCVVGDQLGLPHEMNYRQPFPGPGLGVRCPGAINTTDVMTCTVENIPFELMCHITDRITHEVPGINRVLYDFTPKPTGTVEFE